MRRSLVLATAAALAFAPPATAAPAARTFDLVTYTAPDGFTVDASSSDHVVISRVGTKSYCVIGIYAAGAAGSDLAASFANEWRDVALKTIDPVDAPATTPTQIGGASALVGGAMSKAGGKPVFALLTVVDAGARVVSILVLTPSPDDFKVYLPQVQAFLISVSVQRVEPPANDQAAAPPPAPAHTMKIADLVGDWQHGTGSTQSYEDASTGAYAGYSTVQYAEKWNVSAKGVVTNDFNGVTASSTYGAHQHSEKVTGPATISKDNILFIKWSSGSPQYYLIRGFQIDGDTTTMILNGPYYRPSDFDARLFTDRQYARNLDETFVRKTVKKTK